MSLLVNAMRSNLFLRGFRKFVTLGKVRKTAGFEKKHATISATIAPAVMRYVTSAAPGFRVPPCSVFNGMDVFTCSWMCQDLTTSHQKLSKITEITLTVLSFVTFDPSRNGMFQIGLCEVEHHINPEHKNKNVCCTSSAPNSSNNVRRFPFQEHLNVMHTPKQQVKSCASRFRHHFRHCCASCSDDLDALAISPTAAVIRRCQCGQTCSSCSRRKYPSRHSLCSSRTETS